ncbi:MAG: hypothetical protein IPI42_07925 [Saprospiraceae bacterium]|nr:hypothetical protein [Candidatus Parvibacillus calidus]
MVGNDYFISCNILGLGFLIHDALEKQKYLFITGLLTFTLIVDAIIGYKISQSIHNNEFNAGLTNELWRFDMIYSDINFYLVIALGFVVCNLGCVIALCFEQVSRTSTAQGN